MNKYLVSFGDSDKYAVEFPGKLEEFKNSDFVKGLEDKVEGFLKEKFPTGGYEETVEINVADDDGRDYKDLDKVGFNDLLKSLECQVEVMREGKELNNNAPFDNI